MLLLQSGSISTKLAASGYSSPRCGEPRKASPHTSMLLLLAVLVAGLGIVGCTPRPIREARSLYKKGRFDEADKTISAYISERTDEELVAAMKEEPTSRRGHRFLAEACFLQGQIRLFDPNELYDVESDAFAESFGVAVEINERYGPEAAAELAKAISIILESLSEQRLLDQVVTACSEHVSSFQYGELMSAAEEIRTHSENAVNKARSIARFLNDYDKDSAAELRSRIASKKLSADDIARLELSLASRFMPGMTESLRGLTEDDAIRKTIDVKAAAAFLKPIFVQEGVEAGAYDAFLQLLSCLEAQSAVAFESRRMTREQKRQTSFLETGAAWGAIGIWKPVVGFARYHPELLLEPLIRASQQHSDLALCLLAHIPRKGLNTQELDTGIKDPKDGFDEESAARIAETIRQRFEQVAISYAREGFQEDFRSYWQEVWPGVDMGTIGYALVHRVPDILREDSFVFAVACTNAQWQRESTLTSHPLWKYTAAYYLKEFPRGQYTDLARRFAGGARTSLVAEAGLRTSGETGSQSLSAQPVKDVKQARELAKKLAEQLREAQSLVQNGDPAKAKETCIKLIESGGEEASLSRTVAQARDLLSWIEMAEDPSHRFAIVGAIDAGGKVMLRIRDGLDGQVHNARVGETVAGYTLESVNTRKQTATLAKDGATYVVVRR